MKKQLAVSILLILFIIAILVIGSSSDVESVVDGVAIIEAPEAVVWNHLHDFSAYNKWCDRISITQVNADSVRHAAEYHIQYSIRPGTLQWGERAEIDSDRHIIFCLPLRSKKDSFLETVYSQIGTRKLADGSVEVRWTMHYSVRPLVARVLNMLLLKPRLRHILTSSLSRFKSYIE